MAKETLSYLILYSWTCAVIKNLCLSHTDHVDRLYDLRDTSYANVSNIVHCFR